MPLTDTRLRSLKPNGSRYELPDRNGLTIRVSQRGILTWAVAFRVQGTGDGTGARGGRLQGDKRRFTLGEYPTISLASAREQALTIKRIARAGNDPVETLRPKPKLVIDVGHLLDRYAREHLRRNLRSGSNVEKLLGLHVAPHWGKRELSSITRRDFLNLLEQVRNTSIVTISGAAGSYAAKRGGPGAAAEVRKWVRAMFQFAVDVQLLPDNPVGSVRNRDRQRPRSRVLTMDELQAVWKASDLLAYPWAAYFQLIMLTGDRRGEWANAQVGWLTPDRTRLEIPATHYKTGKAQVVPLSHQAQSILNGLPSPDHGPYLLSSLAGARPISGFSRAKARIDEVLAAELKLTLAPWVVHDLRRSMATHMERLGVEPHIIEVCLGHALKGIGATYRQYTYLTEKAAALQLWADELCNKAPEKQGARPPVGDTGCELSAPHPTM